MTLSRSVVSLPAWLLLVILDFPATGAIFFDDFNNGPLNLSNWVRHGDVAGVGIQAHNDLSIPATSAFNFINVLTADGDNDGALLIGDGDSSGSDYIYAEYVLPVSRGNNTVAQFQSWGNHAVTATVDGVTLPWTDGATSPYGPWHCDPNGPGVNGPGDLPQSAVLGGLGDGGGLQRFRFIATCSWQTGPVVEQAFLDAWDGATSRANSIWIRVYLGDTDGAYGEWSNDDGTTWIPFREEGTDQIIDLRDTGSNATDPAYFALGAACCGGHRWYDNVEIGDDTNPVSDPASLIIPVEGSSIPEEAPAEELIPLDGEALEIASATFEARCSLCHGSDGKGEGEASLNLMDEIWHHGGTLDEIAQTISEGVPDTLMKPQKEKLTAEEIGDLAMYVKVLAREMHAGTDPSGLAAATELTDTVSSGLPAPQNYVEVERVNFIDDYIFDKMKADDIPHAGLSSDMEFMRRLYFDLWGRIPEPSDVREFIADTDPEKRNKMIDKLLCLDKFADRSDAEKEANPEEVVAYWEVGDAYLSKWRFFFEDLFRNFVNGREELHDSFRNFINLFLKYNYPYDEFVRDMITASSITGRSSGASGYLVQARMGSGEGDPIHEDICDQLAIRTSRNFLGVNLECISCHDGEGHLEDVNLWLSKRKRVEFWRQAAFFGETGFIILRRLGTKQPYFIEDGLNATGYHPGAESNTRTPRNKTADVYPAYLTNKERPTEETNLRVDFAHRLTTDFQFAKVAVNLLWSKFFTVGIVDPPFDWDLARQDPDTPPPAPWTLQPSHPKLLDALAKDFVEHKYDLRHLMRTICRSHAYQLSSHFEGEYKAEYDRYYARKLVRRLSAEEVYDAIAKSTNIFGHTSAANPNWKSGYSMDLPSPLSGLQQCDGELREFLFFFGRGNRNTTEPNTNTSMIHTSVMLYSKIVKNKVKANAEGSLTNTLLTEYPPWTWTGSDHLKKLIEEVFLATLVRLPTAEELATSTRHIERYRDKGIENLQWALFNKVEFMVNY